MQTIIKNISIKFLLSFLLLFSFSYAFTQCSGLQIIGFNSDNPDQILFQATADIPAGTVFYFTDNEWDDTTESFNTGEGIETWTAPVGGVAAGSTIFWEGATVTCGTVSDVPPAITATNDEGLYLLSVPPSNVVGSVLATDICFYVLFGGTGSSVGIPTVDLGNADNGLYNGTGDITDSANWTISNSPISLPAAVCTPITTVSCTPPQFRVTATCVDVTTDAVFDEYYVSVEVTDKGSATGDVSVSVGSFTGSITGGVGTIVLGPFTFIDGLGHQVVTVSDTNDSTCNSTAEVSELRCGYTPDNGTDADSALNACGVFCTSQGNATASVTAPAIIAQAAPDTLIQGQTNSTNYVYVLVAGGNVIDVNNNGLFSSLMNATTYTIHAFNVLETDRATFESQFTIGNAYVVPVGSECFSSCGSVTKTPNCFICPTISALSATSPICSGTATTDLMATIGGFFNTENGDEDFDVEFVYSTMQLSAATDVYGTGVTVIGTEDVTAAAVTSVTEGAFTLPSVTTQTTYYIYARILNAATAVNDPNCRPFAETQIIVNPIPTATAASLVVCDNDADGLAAFTLTDADATVLNGQTGMTVTYHATQPEADSGMADLNSPYTNTTANTQTVYARVESAAGCFATSEVTLTVNPLPVLMAQTETLCSDAATFDLTSLQGDITTETGTFDYTVGGVAVIDPTAYTATNGDVVDVKFTLTSTSCMASTTITFTVNSNPTAGTAAPFTLCNADPTQFTVDLFANISGESTGGVWTADTGNPSALDITDPTDVDFQNAIAGDYTFTYEVTGTAPCGNDTEALVITVTNCFDLALTKVLKTTGVVKPGESVTFDVAVINQGSVAAFDVDILDIYNSGELTFVSAAISSNDASSSTGSQVSDGFTIDEIAVGATAIVEVTMTINASFTGNTIINNAEITGGASVDGGADALDADSMPGSEDGTIVDPNDGDTAMTDGSDDYDPAMIMICQSGCGTFPWDGTN